MERLGGHFPNLRTLIVCENPIEEIPPTSRLETLFPHLQKLSITKTLISDWTSLDQLRRVPQLSDIRFAQIPLLETCTDAKLLRQLLIARLPNMGTMNGGLIQAQEREDAERAFIRHYKYLEDKPVRYAELVKIHGELEDLANVCLSDKPSHTLVNVKGDIHAETSLKLDLQLKTGELKKQIATRFGLEMKRFRLFCTSVEGFQEEMKPKSKKLYLYRLCDGDDILVQRLDLGDDDLVPTSPSSPSSEGGPF